MIKINCTSCNKPLSLDETKLPMKEVTFPCPACKTKLKVDRRKLEEEAAAEASLKAAAAGEGSDTAPSEDDDDFTTEKGLIVGVDDPALRQAIKSIGFQPVFHPSPEAARDFFLREYPPVIVLHPQALTPPPLAEMAPLTSVSAADRRKGFYILVADNLRTLDGNAAFLYGMNLVLAKKDLGQFRQVYRDADNFHRRLYHNVTTLTA